VEDPVEYVADGISSVQVDAARGLGFASVLRAALRQSPNILFVGEIRDEATAAVAVQAALTGHFVCSTLHCRDAAGAVARLIELKIPSHLIEAVLRGVLSQRLVRRLCMHCRERCAPASGKFADIFRTGAGNDLFRQVGCDHCGGSGYFGQTAIYEWMPISAGRNLRQNIGANVAVPLNDCARMKVADGVTSQEEAYAAIC
jgi:type II secretory ATPase GspE/PulE/Tfp pilus assembly ATPase PilB-like protein